MPMLDYLYNLATDRSKGFVASVLKFILFILSLVYGLAVRMVMFICRLRQYRANCKVISVGNITLGGTGKTPLVEFLARRLKDNGHRVAIITRGYRRKGTRYLQPTTYNLQPNSQLVVISDEAVMLQAKLGDIPVIVDANRKRAIKLAINKAADTVILDDGFQQWKIKKDLEIVAIDSTNPLGNSQLLPRGILRQPLGALKYADIFLLTKANIQSPPRELKRQLAKLNPRAIIAEASHEPAGFYEITKPQELLAGDYFQGKIVALVSGIADPAYFEKSILDLGIKSGLSFQFPDHYEYSQQILEKIISESKRKSISAIITTEKDAAKIGKLPIANSGLPIIVFRVELKIIKYEEGFLNRLSRVYRA